MTEHGTCFTLCGVLFFMKMKNKSTSNMKMKILAVFSI